VLISMQEREDDFTWAFEQFMIAFKVAPRVIVTDGDPAMAAAVRNVFATATKHHLCVYHISLNFTEHIKKCFSDVGDWKVVLDAFWRVAKETDQRKANDAAFNQEFDAIVAYVENAECTDKTKQGALKWLESLRERKEKWESRATRGQSSPLVFTPPRFGAAHASSALRIHAATSRQLHPRISLLVYGSTRG